MLKHSVWFVLLLSLSFSLTYLFWFSFLCAVFDMHTTFHWPAPSCSTNETWTQQHFLSPFLSFSLFFYCKLFNFRFLFALFVCFLTCILLIPLWALPALSISSALSTCKSNEMYKILTALHLHVDKLLGPSLRIVGACCNSCLTVECLVRCSLIRVDHHLSWQRNVFRMLTTLFS